MQAENPALKRPVRIYTLFQFFFSLLLWVPIFYEYQKQKGLNEAEIFQIQSLYYLAFCLFELPTGWFADRWGYRQSLLLGSLVLVLSNLLPLFWVTAPGFLLHFLGVALARSLISGAASAYLYDFLSGLNQEGLYASVEGRARAVGLVGRLFGWALVGKMMAWRLDSPYLFTAFFAGISAYFAGALPSVQKTGMGEEKRRQQWGGYSFPALLFILRKACSNSALRWISLLGAFFFVLSRLFTVNLYQPILFAYSIPSWAHGLGMSVLTGFEALGSAYPNFLQRWFSDLSSLVFLTGFMGLSVVGLGLGNVVIMGVALCLFSWISGAAFPLQKALMNDAIQVADPAIRNQRATLLSLESVFDRAIASGVAAFLGGILAAGHLKFFIVAVGMMTVLVAVLISQVWLARRS